MSREPIAIVGIGCRFPGGANDPRSFWKMLAAGVDAIREVPPDRWSVDGYFDPTPGRNGKSITRWGGFVDAIDRFDPGFFGISPREASFMDPQQRLLLETAWEAIDDAGQSATRLRGSATGAFVGISTHDYELLQSSPDERSDLDIYSTTGGVLSIAANRLSYCFDLRGPSLAIDTACSSSLIAAHLACESLWAGDCSLALVGGVNALIAPMPFVAFSRMSMLSPTGRCHAFDARADGFVRAEGAGVVVLRPLGAALADGDRIYAVIRGTAANQDGRTNGITVPSAAAQAALVRAACARAGVAAADVAYVEAHGTGTPVGDPIEASALGESLGEGRDPARPCIVGSVKTNIGHLEAGAGIAGLVKLALVLHHGAIPPSLHFETPNPNIDFDRLKLRVPRTLEPLPAGAGEPPLAGINSFGFGGANAHAVLQAPVTRAPAAQAEAEPARARVLVVSAKTPDALRAAAELHADRVVDRTRPGSLDAICHTAGARRTHHAERVAVVGDDRSELAAGLRAFVAGEADARVIAGKPLAEGRSDVAFVFSGQGPQWWGMGRELAREEPVFRRALEACEQELARHARWSLLEELGRDEKTSRLAETAIAQPAIFALQVALARLWESWGVRPAAVVGHSVGEVAAAHVAGALTLGDAARVIFERGRCMDLATERGRMLAAGLTAEQANDVVAPYRGLVAVGAINGPASVTLSGRPEALEEIAGELERQQVFCRFLQVNYAFHSAQMDPIQEELLRALGEIPRTTTEIPMISSVTGGELVGDELGAEYWWRNVRQTVRFAPAVDALVRRGWRLFVELSAHPALVPSVAECLKHRGAVGVVVPSLRRKQPEGTTMTSALAALHVAGAEVDWDGVHPESRAVTELPGYPWQRDRYWHESAGSRVRRLEPSLAPFLARDVHAARPTFEGWLDGEAMPYLRDHALAGHVVFPAAGYVEIALEAAERRFGPTPCRLEDVDFVRACVVPDGEDAARVEIAIDPAESRFTIATAGDAERASWILHCAGRLRADVPGEHEPVSLRALERRLSERVAADEIYRRFHDVGLDFGPAFRGIRSIRRIDGEALGRVEATEAVAASRERHRVHPALLDACFQVLSAALPRDGTGSSLYLPVHVERIRFLSRLPHAVWSHARLVRRGGNAIVGDIRILDDAGAVLVAIEGFRCQAMRPGREDSPESWIYESRWEPKPLPGSPPSVLPADFVTPAARAADAARALLARRQRAGSIRARFLAVEPDLDRLAAVYVVAALRALGWTPRTGETLAAASLAAKLGIASAHAGVLARFLELLASVGVLAATSRGFRVRRVPAVEDPDALWRALLARVPALHPELVLLRRTGGALAAILSGERDALAVLAPGGSLVALEQFYQDSPSFDDYNQAVATAVATATAAAPYGRRIRVLEIGAGTGGTTAHVLPRLPADTEYVFTDVSASFFARAEQKFFDHGSFRCQLFDAERAPETQGFEPHAFDVVLASDALHATADVGRALAHARSLLAPGGVLVLLEIDRPTRWIDLVFGLTAGWWRFTDRERRPAHPLLDRDGWRRALVEAGFDDVAVASDVRGAERSGQSVIVARVPGRSTAVDAPATAHAPSAWLVLADRGGIGEALAARLEAGGDRVAVAFAADAGRALGAGRFEVDVRASDGFARLLAEMPFAPRGVVHLWALDGPSGDDATLASLRAADDLGPIAALHLVQALSSGNAAEPPRIVLVTRGSQPVGGSPVLPAQAPLWALGRVVQNEQRRLRCRMVDLDPGDDAADAVARLAVELDADDREDEVAWRGGARFVNRLVRGTIEQRPIAAREHLGWRLEIPTPGSLDGLRLVSRARRRPGPGEVEIAVGAAALNFRDVMKALGIYPIESDADLLVGDECAGTIVAVGRGVRGLRAGDRVLAMAGGCFASHLTVPAGSVAKIPASLSFAEAATIPVVFLTAAYALHELAGMRRGETLLVQAATGGVGLAALQLAARAGVETLATAGSPEKRDFLRALGVAHVMDSRTLAFADEVMAATDGRGVDLVLNSLAGEAIGKGLECLAPHGRFLEIGKRDVYQDTRIGLRPFRKSLSMFVIDLPQVMRDQPERTRRVMTEMLRAFARRELHPLPHRAFGASQVGAAFRFMAKAQHVGKVVVSMDDEAVRPEPGPEASASFRGDATYLVTGGLGGFGLALADWLVANGARSIVLAGRSGAASAQARRAVSALRRRGARVTVAKADVGDERSVERLLATIARTLPPLRGVFHAAMVLDDGVLAQLDRERFARVMAPKAHGAWNLHVQTRSLPLDHFVMFSSVSSIVGAPAQGNYVAANGFLDALAHHRRGLGLPALTVNWGQLSEVGYVARHQKVEEHLNRQGILGIRPADALALLGRLLDSRAPQLGVVRVDWQRWASFLPAVATAPRTAGLMAAASTADKSESGVGIRDTVLEAGEEERLALVVAHVREQVARVLRTPAAKLDAARPLAELGVDSLMAFELVNRIESQFSLALPTSRLTGGATIERLAAVLLEVLTQAPAAAVEPSLAPGAAGSAAADRVLTLREGVGRPALFCIHPAGGLANIYRHLAQALPDDLPVVALQSRAIADGLAEHESLAELAREYATRIVERQPSGPVHLLGFSLGGVLALAIARVLEERGVAVAFVGLVDTDLSLTLPGRRTGDYVREHVVDMWRTFAREFVMLRQMDASALDAEAAELAARVVTAPPSDRGKAIVGWLEARGHLAATGLSPDLLERYFTLFDAHAALVEGVTLGEVRGPVVLWHRGHEGNGDAEHLATNLRLLRGAAPGGARQHPARGSHYELMYPPLVERLAAEIDAELRGIAQVRATVGATAIS